MNRRPSQGTDASTVTPGEGSGAVRWRGKSTDGPDTIFANYRPRDATPYWQDAGQAFVQALLSGVPVTSRTTAYRMVIALTDYVIWANEQDLPESPGIILSRDRVENYLSSGSRRDLGPGVIRERRAALKKVALAVAPGAGWPTTTPPAPRNFSPPYTAAEVDGYIDASHKQPSERLTRYMVAIIAFAHGAGLSSAEVRSIRARNIADGPEYLSVISTITRTTSTPINIRYSSDVRQLTLQQPNGLLVGPVSEFAPDPLAQIRAHLRIPSYLPPLDPRRLRASWFRDQLQAGIPIKRIASITGMKSMRLDQMLNFLELANDEQDLRALAGIETKVQAAGEVLH
jgi:integrase